MRRLCPWKMGSHLGDLCPGPEWLTQRLSNPIPADSTSPEDPPDTHSTRPMLPARAHSPPVLGPFHLGCGDPRGPALQLHPCTSQAHHLLGSLGSKHHRWDYSRKGREGVVKNPQLLQSLPAQGLCLLTLPFSHPALVGSSPGPWPSSPGSARPLRLSAVLCHVVQQQ